MILPERCTEHSIGKEMNGNNLTERELERILRDSRFPNEEHKRDLHERIFGKRAQNGVQGSLKEAAQITELSPEDLEMVAGGRAADPGVRPEELFYEQ